MSNHRNELVKIPQSRVNDAVQYAMNETMNMVQGPEKTSAELYNEQKHLYETIFRMGYLAGYHRREGETILETLTGPDNGE